MSKDEIEKLQAEAIEVVSHFCKREVTKDTRLVADLDLDSLDTAELVAEIEEHFDVVIPMEKLPEMRTVGDIAQNLASLCASKKSAESVS
jgi:acyl carrier protein